MKLQHTLIDKAAKCEPLLERSLTYKRETVAASISYLEIKKTTENSKTDDYREILQPKASVSANPNPLQSLPLEDSE
jgi:hypothetical protein